MNDITVFSVNAIAIDIARQYYLKEFPKKRNNEFLLFPAEEITGSRGDFGYVMVARIAALIPYVVKIYMDYKGNFNAAIQEQINLNLNAARVKTMQVVALMYASGRWYKPYTDPVIDPNSIYEKQNILECKKKLEELGINSTTSHEFAMLLKQNDYQPKEPYQLLYAILQDTIAIINANNKTTETIAKLHFTNFIEDHANNAIKNKFIALIQGLAIARVRQQAVVIESETSFHPITLSYKRILGSLFYDLEASFAILEKKEQSIALTTEETAISYDNSSISIELQAMLAEYTTFNEIQTAIDNFINNVDDIQNKLGTNKTKYASNLWIAWRQIWNRAYNVAMEEFKSFQENAKKNCNTQQEYLTTIDKKIRELDHG